VVDQDGQTLPKEIFEIEFGLHDLRFLQSASSGRVSKVIPYERYRPGSHRFDIALLKLEIAVTFSAYVQPTCLWTESIKTLADKNTLGLAIGWGDTGKGILSNELRAANLLIRDTDDCREDIKEIQGLLHSTHFCAGYKNGTSMCLGDSGGGMFLEIKETFYMVGIVSFSAAIVGENGITCGRDDYSVFMSIPNLFPWIQANTRSKKYTDECEYIWCVLN
jgi:secreted trypsin-like serine protease